MSKETLQAGHMNRLGVPITVSKFKRNLTELKQENPHTRRNKCQHTDRRMARHTHTHTHTHTYIHTRTSTHVCERKPAQIHNYTNGRTRNSRKRHKTNTKVKVKRKRRYS